MGQVSRETAKFAQGPQGSQMPEGAVFHMKRVAEVPQVANLRLRGGGVVPQVKNLRYGAAGGGGQSSGLNTSPLASLG